MQRANLTVVAKLSVVRHNLCKLLRMLLFIFSFIIIYKFYLLFINYNVKASALGGWVIVEIQIKCSGTQSNQSPKSTY